MAAGAFAVASPALADAPSGNDFSQKLPAAEQLHRTHPRAVDGSRGYGGHGPVLYRTAPIKAPQRFDLVGVAGEEHALEYRARHDGESWTDWAEVDNGDPVYAGGADQVQIRSRGVPIEGRLHYVNVADGTIPADRLAARNDTGESAGDVLSRPHGGKRLPQPKFITRAQWGANSPQGGCEPREAPITGRVKAGVIHHTVNLNTYTQLEAPGIVLGICRYHRNGNGWNDIGYNALVDRFGNLYEGRAGGLSRAIIGAQAEGVNSQTTGIASIGDHRETGATSKARGSIASYLAWKFSLTGIPAEGRTSLKSAGGSTQRTPEGQRVRVPRIFSHSETNFTVCAGEALVAQIPSIRRAVAAKLGGAVTPPPTTPPAPGTGTGRR